MGGGVRRRNVNRPVPLHNRLPGRIGASIRQCVPHHKKSVSQAARYHWLPSGFPNPSHNCKALYGYEFFYSKKEYYQCCAYLFSGMTIFLIICTIWHNGLDLRQDISYNNNLCAKLVKMLYKTDTSTNVFPSLHVFNTLGCLVALYRSKGVKDKAWIKVIATVIGILIILSTMFLKQHSVRSSPVRLSIYFTSSA